MENNKVIEMNQENTAANTTVEEPKKGLFKKPVQVKNPLAKFGKKKAETEEPEAETSAEELKKKPISKKKIAAGIAAGAAIIGVGVKVFLDKKNAAADPIDDVEPEIDTEE